jgi:hypothetical protein
MTGPKTKPPQSAEEAPTRADLELFDQPARGAASTVGRVESADQPR